MSLVDPLPAGAFTLTGKTQGPAVNLGRNRYSKSQMVFMHVDEIRDACVRAGLHIEADYQQLLAEHSVIKDAFTVLQAEHDQALAKIEGLEKALGWKPEAAATPKAPKKPKTETLEGH